MLLAVVVITIAGFVPAVLPQSNQYYPHFLYYFLATNSNNYRLTTIMDNDGTTYVFRPYANSLATFAIFETKDFQNVRNSKSLSHFAGGDVIPLFVVYDKNTAGFGNDFLIGFQKAFTDDRKISRLQSGINVVCEGCITENISGDVITSWDTKRKRWVSVVKTASGTSFAVSNNLKVWDNKIFLPTANSAVLKRAIEVFPIADDDDASKVTWIIIRKSDTDPSALLYSTFVPDDANPQYKEMGVLDASTNYEEFAVVNSNSTDYRHRKVVAVKRAEYREFGVKNNMYISFRVLSFSDDKLRQMPISTVFPTPMYVRLFPSVSYTPGDIILYRLLPSSALAIEAEVKPYPRESFGFDFFISNTNRDDLAVGLLVNCLEKRVYLARFNWFAAGPKVPKDTYGQLYVDYGPDVIDVFDVLIVVDTISVEYFMQKGLYVGQIFAFPRSDMKQHEFYATGPVDVRNMRVRIFR